ncbi:MAG: DUF4132 domain-containing protein [Propioniciclava sp.]
MTEGLPQEPLQELSGRPDTDVHQLLAQPGLLMPVYWVKQKHLKPLRKLGIVGPAATTRYDIIHPVQALRGDCYANASASVVQWSRFGRLLEMLGPGADRTVDGVPVWFTALVNDVVATANNPMGAPPLAPQELAPKRPTWTADFLASLLAAEGVAPEEIPTLVFWTLFEATGDFPDGRISPADLPGVASYFSQHARSVPATAVAHLTPAGRVHLAERATRSPAMALALAPLLAALSVDTAKNARAAAISALGCLPPAELPHVLAPVLVEVPASRGAEIISFLAGAEGGAAILAEAGAANSRIASLIERSTARHSALQGAGVPEELALPPFTPLPDSSAAPARAEVRRALDAMIARYTGSDDVSGRWNVERARSISEEDLDALVACAEGRGSADLALFQTFSVGWVLENAPSLNLVHRLRLVGQTSPGSLLRLIDRSVDPDTDARTVEDALRRTGQPVGEVATWVLRYGEPGAVWPWVAGHRDQVATWLREDHETQALKILAAFPTPPASFLLHVADIAVGTSKVNRLLAQEVLDKHPARRALAEQALTDSRSEARSAAARWLASQADPKAVPALREALKKEKKEVVRASLLGALQASGDDLADELSPAALLAEAKKGLKAKRPPSLEWFDVDRLPEVRWFDGAAVDPEIIQWWVVLADKLKNPNGLGLIDHYLSLLDPRDAAALGEIVLRAWITQDTLHPSDAESRAHAATVGRRRHARLQEWWKRARSSSDGDGADIEALAAIPVETHIAEAYSEHQDTYLGSATADKGLLALTTRMHGPDLANAVQAYFRAHPARRSQFESLVFALFANGQPAAMQLLLSVARRHKMAGIQATARELVEELAETRGWTPDELADRTIPTAGFSEDHLLHLDYGARSFVGRLTPKGTIALTNEAGRGIASLPTPRVGDDAELVKETKTQLAGARKELKAVIALQTGRLYEAMCVERTWRAGDWTEFLSGHPLMAQLIPRLIWVENPGGDDPRTFRPTEDGALIDVSDASITLGVESTVGLAHRTGLADDAAEAWQAHLADYDVTALFDQLSARAPAFEADAAALADLKGHVTDTFSFRGVAGKRGYQRATAEDAGWFTAYLKPFSSVGLTAVLGFTGSFVPEENIPCATETLTFRRGRRPVALAEVPPVVLAECYADYAALAALGPFDPDYEKRTAW